LTIHFFIRIPFARFVNPITKTDWEGTGVEPDVKVSAAEALAVAEKLATRKISNDRYRNKGTG
jgi:C-terminal processing protease CtpA/Prc